MKITLKELKSLIKEAVQQELLREERSREEQEEINRRYYELKDMLGLTPEQQKEMDDLFLKIAAPRLGPGEEEDPRDFPEFDFGDEPVRHPDADRERLRRR